MRRVAWAGAALILASAALAQDVPLVPAVNSLVAASSLAVIQRQVSGAIDATSGTVAWTFPTAFKNDPTCFTSLVATNATYSFDSPLVVAISRTSVTLKITSHPTSLSVTSLTLPIALPLTVNPPVGTTVTLTCVGALP